MPEIGLQDSNVERKNDRLTCSFTRQNLHNVQGYTNLGNESLFLLVAHGALSPKSGNLLN